MDNKFNYEVLGVEPINYKSKRTREQVQGIVVYCGVPLDIGYKCDVQCFFRGADANAFVIGEEVIPLYNKYGQVVDLKSV